MSVYPLGHVLTQTPLLLRYLDSLALDADCVACASGAFKDIEVAAALPDSCKHYSLKCVAEHFLIGAESSGTPNMESEHWSQASGGVHWPQLSLHASQMGPVTPEPMLA